MQNSGDKWSILFGILMETVLYIHKLFGMSMEAGEYPLVMSK